ncbi:unnamed protein product [Protopolystoma xenopodis]|uniref:Apple domain-containing protein n=1 Tax=Protopolystoma xenopodis TaxID=117903 RepID=A0A448XAR4_9PLAT|nr:unnamed protein product [Protopolystoma xenopodis]
MEGQCFPTSGICPTQGRYSVQSETAVMDNNQADVIARLSKKSVAECASECGRRTDCEAFEVNSDVSKGILRFFAFLIYPWSPSRP